MEEEIWKDVPQYEGLYQASTLGRVRSIDRVVDCKRDYQKHLKGKIISQKKHMAGYKIVCLSKNGNETHFFTHIVIARTFIENPENKPQVDHINTIRDDNRVCNLRWVSQSENNQNAITKQRMKDVAKISTTQHRFPKGYHPPIRPQKKGGDNPAAKAVVQYSRKGEYIADYGSLTEAAAAMNKKNVVNILQCCKGYRKTAFGYIWKYKSSNK